MKKLPPTERVAAHILPLLAEDRGNPRLLLDDRHMAMLAALRLFVVAVLPFEERHLLRQPADGLAVRSEGGRVQRVAGRAQLRLTDVQSFGRHKAGGRVHHRRLPALDLVRPERAPLFERRRRVDHVAAREAFWRAEPIGQNLVTDGARHTIGREQIRLVPALIERQVLEDLRGLSRRALRRVRHRHVAHRTLVLDGRGGVGVVEDFAPHGGLPVRVARRVRHHRGAPRCADRNVLAARGRQPVVAGDAVLARDEQRAPMPGDDRPRRRLRRPRLVALC